MNSGKGDDVAALAKFGYFPDQLIYEGKPWSLITSAFVHVEMVHIAFNLYWMWLIGGAFEFKFGPIKLLAFVFAAALVSSGIQLFSGSTGIGLSGVVYALFGFEWIARSKYPEFRRVVTEQVATVFLVWGVVCIPLTYLKILNVGNLAHFGGFLFGVLAAAIIIVPRYRALLAPALALTIAAAILPIFWNPNSTDWLAVQAMKASESEDWASAAKHYRSFIEKGGDPIWGWANLAQIYGYRQDKPAYKEAVERLRALDAKAADEMVKEYGPPE